MQKGIIKEVNEIAQEGKKTFYRVKLQDGAEMSTFDSKIKQAEAGDGLEFDVTVAGRFINLKDGFTITKSASSVFPGKGNGYPDMSKEDWAEKQCVERDSIEAQTAVNRIFGFRENLNTMSIEPNDDFTRIFNKALAWCETRIDAAIAPVKPPVKAPAKDKASQKEKPAPISPDEVEFDDSPVQNFGDLWTRCGKVGIPKEEGLEILEVESQVLIIDLDEAWKTIFDRKFGKQESEP